MFEGDEHVEHARRGADRAGQARAGASSAWSTRPRSRPATSCACRRRTRSTTRTTRPTSRSLRAGSTAQHAERPPGRAQRHAPLQQPGPLDVHGHAHRREHRSADARTTSGA
ncbi:MAG: hypothetical protein WKG07_45790 [Hymenobacter sp.]